MFSSKKMSVAKILALTAGLWTLVIFFCYAIDLPTGETGVPPAGNSIYIDSIDILLLESFPVQARVLIKGNLSDPCHKLNEPQVTKEGNAFLVRLTAAPPPPTTGCIMVLEPFEKNIALDIYGLSAGLYTVEVNGIGKTFELTSDNKLGN